MDDYKNQRQQLYDQITEILAKSPMPWCITRTVLMQIKQDIYIAEGKMGSREMVDFIRSARGNNPIEE